MKELTISWDKLKELIDKVFDIIKTIWELFHKDKPDLVLKLGK